MTAYYVNKNAQSNGDHEVHITGCPRMPDPDNRIPLGDFRTCHAAVMNATKHYDQVNGCFYCANECHTS